MLSNDQERWYYTVLDDRVPSLNLSCLALGDINEDGIAELVVGGDGAIFWYDLQTFTRHMIASGIYHVGIAIDDLDGDGLPEIIVATRDPQIVFFKAGGSLSERWIRQVIDPSPLAGAHDLISADIDGDGEKEVIVNAKSDKREPEKSGLFYYKRNGALLQGWTRHTIQRGYYAEGLVAGDVNNDHRMEVVSGPKIYFCPESGPASGPWASHTYAPGFRQECRAQLVDIAGKGMLDVVLSECEYVHEGKLAWFENLIGEGRTEMFIEHVLESGLKRAHSLCADRDTRTGAVRVFVAEMSQGYDDPAPNPEARLIEFISEDHGRTWNRVLIHQGNGTHQACLREIGEGKKIIAGKQWLRAKVQLWRNHLEIPKKGLVFWLKADEGVVRDDCGQVARWLDQSRSSEAAMQQKPESRPLDFHESSSGIKAVQFDGIDDHLVFPITALDSRGDMTVILVSANTRYTFRNNDSEGGDGGILNSLLSIGVLADRDLADSFVISPFQRSVQSNHFAWYRPASIQSAYSITAVVVAEREKELFVNGRWVLSARGQNEYQSVVKANVGWIGKGRGDSFFPGRVAEVMIYGRSLSMADRSSVESYLAAKYNLHLDSQNY